MHSTLARPISTHTRRALASVALAWVVLAMSLMVQAVPASAVAGGSGFVWADNPTATFYTPSRPHQFNTASGLPNTIERLGVGRYAVRFPGLASAGGTVHVTAYGGTNDRCQVSGWWPEGGIPPTGAERVEVQCTTATGTPADTYFTATFVTGASAYGRMGYVHADQPTASSYAPAAAYQTNSTGASNGITRTAVGDYTVTMPGLGTSGGHVQVTGVGYKGGYCKTTTWYQSGTVENIGVSCVNAIGARVDSRFTLTFVDRMNILGQNTDTHISAYAWADRPYDAIYSPAAAYRFATQSGATTIRRASVGSYAVSFPIQPGAGSNVQVTAYGAGTSTCKVASRGSSGIQVRCFTVGGAPIDSYFTVTFVGPFVPG